MDCEKFDAHVMDELYEELDDITHAALRRHVDGCARCSAAFSSLRATRSAAMLPIEEPSEDLEDRILLAAAAAQRTVPWPKRALRAIAWAGSHAMRPQLAMAAVLVLILGSSLLLLRAKPGASALAPVQVSERGTPSDERGATLLAEPPSPAAAAPAEAQAPGAAAAKAEESERAQAGDPAQVALDEARAARSASGCGVAAGKLEDVSKRFPGSPAAAAATWDAAECYRTMGDEGKARELYLALRDNQAFAARAGEKLAGADAKGKTSLGGGAGAHVAAAPMRAAADQVAFEEAPAPAAPPPAAKAAAPKKAASPSGSGENAAPHNVQTDAH